MLLDYLIWVILAVNIFLGLGVFLRNPAAKVNKFFAIFATLLGLWIISNFLENEPRIIGLANVGLFLRLDFLFAIFLLYAWLRFSMVFADGSFSEKKSRWLNTGFLFVTAVLGGLSFTELVIKDISFYDGVVHFESGLLWPAYTFFILFFIVGGLVFLFLGRRRAKKEKALLLRQQINLVFAGFLISFANAAVVNLYLQPLQLASLEISRIGIYGMTFLVALTAYAVTKHRFFDIKPVIVRAVSFVVILVLIAFVYTLTLFLGLEKITGTQIEIPVFIAVLTLTTAAMLTFRPLENSLRRLTNRILFKRGYDSNELLSRLTKIMVSTINLKSMTRHILKTLVEEINLAKAAFLIVDDHKIVVITTIGYEDRQLVTLESLFHEYSSAERRFVFDELTEGPLKNLFRKSDISAALPITVENKEVAILILGPKLSGEAYYQKDINFLDTFASEAGIAIQNAKSYLEIQKFTGELEKRVEARTRELEKLQSQELAKAQEVSRLKDEFVFIATHELRTPITAIRGFLQLVSETSKNFPKDVQNNLNAIAAASNVLNQLINDLLETARSESGSMKIETSKIDIISVIEEAIGEVTPLAEEKKVKINLLPPPEESSVMADRKKLHEVITNLLSNAIKYNKEGGLVDVCLVSGEGNLMVEVRDTGYGIPEEDRDKIFQKFYRAVSKETKEVLGTGLGLFITRMLIEKMGGKIMFSSLKGEGTTFAFSLPRA